MIWRHVIYCDHYPDGVGEAGSNARERKPATVSHEFAVSHHLPRLTVTNQIVFDQRDSKSISNFERSMDRCLLSTGLSFPPGFQIENLGYHKF